jgi:hypothetical protein
MATFNKINDFVEDVVKGVHDFSTDVLKYALSNTAPGSETSDPSADGNGVLANVTEIAYTNLAEDRSISTIVVSLSSGTVKVDGDDEVLTASGGSVGPFRYIYLYNDTATGDPLIGYWDYGSSVTLSDTETFTLTLDSDNFFSLV